MSDDIITKEDEHKHATVADLKRARQQLNQILGQFQRDAVTSQVRLNLVWNAINAILRAFLDKRLVSDAEIREAGQKLMEEARRNIEVSKAAVAANQMPTGLTESPMEHVGNLIYPSKKTDKES